MKKSYYKKTTYIGLLGGIWLSFMNFSVVADTNTLALPDNLTVSGIVSATSMTAPTVTATASMAAPTVTATASMTAPTVKATTSMTAPTFIGTLTGGVSYTTKTATITKDGNCSITAGSSTSTSIYNPCNLAVSINQGFCFLSGWDTDGNASSSGSVSYNTTAKSWTLAVDGHSNVKATATCLLWSAN